MCKHIRADLGERLEKFEEKQWEHAIQKQVGNKKTADLLI